GSAVNISYNAIQIVGTLEAPQKQAFYHLLIGYNAITYPICVGIACWLLVPVIRTWKELHRRDRQIKSEIGNSNPSQGLNTDETRMPFRVASVFHPWPRFSDFRFRVSDVVAMRRRALAFPIWTAGLSCLGW